MTAQQRNAELVSLLATDFVLRRDPARTIRSSIDVSDPPTDAELTAGLGAIADLPNDTFFINDDAGGGGRTYGILTDRTNSKWWRWRMFADGETMPGVGGTLVAFATPDLTLGTSNVAGAASTVIRSDATILTFDATMPETLGPGVAQAVGVATVAARRDHVHAISGTASHVLATETALGAYHTITGGVDGYVLRASGATAANFQQLIHGDLGSVGTDDHHAKSHIITSASDHTVTGAALDIVGLSTTNTLAILTPSSNPGAASAILKSDASGYLQLERLGLGIAPSYALHISKDGGASAINLATFANSNATYSQTLYITMETSPAKMITLKGTSSTGGFRFSMGMAGEMFRVDDTTGRFGIYTKGTASARLHVKGGSDEVQVAVQANATQTYNLQEWQNSGGTAQSVVDENGYIGIGNPAPTNWLTVNPTFNTTGTHYATRIQPTLNTAATTLAANYTNSLYSGTGTLTYLYGVVSNVNKTSTGPVTYASAGYFRVLNLNASGAIANGRGISIATPAYTGAITTLTGLYIEDQLVGGTNYAIYTNGGANRLGDQLTIDGSQDAIQLIVKANATQTANLQEWQNSGGTAMTSITPTGGILFAGANSITTGADSLTIAPAGDIILNPTGNDVMPGTGYDINLGSLITKYLSIHAAELWVSTLVSQNTVATIGGRILIGPTTSLTRDLASAATTIYVKHNEMASGDRAYMESNSMVEFFAITSAPTLEGAGDYSYTVTRNLDGTGANDWIAGDAMFNTGAAGDGFIDIYSVGGVDSGVGPAIAGNVRIDTTYNNWSTHWAIGNLNGTYGYASAVYGAAFGEYVAGKNHITIDSTSGFRIFNGVATVMGQWAVDGDVFIGSDISDPGLTYISIFTTPQTYNTEVFEAGDMLIGDNTASKANIFWDKNGGILYFRGGQTPQAYVATDGTITAGGGKVRISSTGIELDKSTAGISNINAYKFKTGAAEYGGIYSYSAAGNVFDYTAYAIAAKASTIDINTNAPAGYGATTIVQAYGSTAASLAQIYVYGTTITSPTIQFNIGGTTRAEITNAAISLNLPTTVTGDAIVTVDGRFGGGLYVGSVAADPGVGDLYVTSDVRVGAGLHVGNITTNPTADVISCDGAINAGNQVTAGSYVSAVQYVSAGSYLQVGTGAHIGSAGTIYDNDLVVDGGIMVGRTADPGAGNIQYTGALQSYKNSTAYTAYAYVPLATKLTSATWNGTASKGVADAGFKTLTTDFPGYPANTKAVNLRVAVRTTATGSTKYLAIGPDSSNYNIHARSQVSNIYSEINGITAVDASSRVYFLFGGTIENVIVEILGYFI